MVIWLERSVNDLHMVQHLFFIAVQNGILPCDSYAVCGICCRRMCVCVCVCHTPVLYRNG